MKNIFFLNNIILIYLQIKKIFLYLQLSWHIRLNNYLKINDLKINDLVNNDFFLFISIRNLIFFLK